MEAQKLLPGQRQETTLRYWVLTTATSIPEI
jgi:hypothetical protein